MYKVALIKKKRAGVLNEVLNPIPGSALNLFWLSIISQHITVLSICRPQSRDEKETFGLKNDGEKEIIRHVNATFGLNSHLFFQRSDPILFLSHQVSSAKQRSVSLMSLFVVTRESENKHLNTNSRWIWPICCWWRKGNLNRIMAGHWCLASLRKRRGCPCERVVLHWFLFRAPFLFCPTNDMVFPSHLS